MNPQLGEPSNASVYSQSETNLRFAWMLVCTLAAGEIAGVVLSPGSRSTPLVLALHHYNQFAAAPSSAAATRSASANDQGLSPVRVAGGLNGNGHATPHAPPGPTLAAQATANGATGAHTGERLAAPQVGGRAVAPRSEALPTYVVLDERAAAFVALGLARATYRPAVLLCTSGSAAAHYLPALVEATESGVPLILLTADRPRELHHVGAPQTTAQAHLFGTAAIAHTQDLPAPSGDLDPRTGPRVWASAALHALHAASQHSAPVQVNCPFREPLWAPTDRPAGELLADLRESGEAGERTRRATSASPRETPAPAKAAPQTSGGGPLPRTYQARGGEPDARVCAAVLHEHIVPSKRGVILVGPQYGRHAQMAATAAVALARRLRWPVVADALSAVRGGDEVLVTHADSFPRTHREELAGATETVLLLGRAPTMKRINQWLATVPASATVVQLGDEPGRTRPDPQHRVTDHLGGEPARVVARLLEILAQAEHGDESDSASNNKSPHVAGASCHERIGDAAPSHQRDEHTLPAESEPRESSNEHLDESPDMRAAAGEGSWLARWQHAEQQVAASLATHADGEDAPWTEATLARRLVRLLPKEARLHVASSMPVRDVNSFAAVPRKRLTVTANRGVNGIDGTVATALGLALGEAAPVVALLGDLAYWHDLDGVHTAAQLTRERCRSLVLVVVDNAGGHIFDRLAIAQHPDEQAYARYFVTPPRTGDICKSATALGAASAKRLDGLPTLEAALHEALPHPGLHLLHAPMDAQPNQSWNEEGSSPAFRPDSYG